MSIPADAPHLLVDHSYGLADPLSASVRNVNGTWALPWEWETGKVSLVRKGLICTCISVVGHGFVPQVPPHSVSARHGPGTFPLLWNIPPPALSWGSSDVAQSLGCPR